MECHGSIVLDWDVDVCLCDGGMTANSGRPCNER